MSTEQLVFKEIKIGGLGTAISSISAMISIEQPVIWQVDGSTESERAMLQYIVDCYGISRDSFRFYFPDTPLGQRKDITDICKFFSPYIPAEKIIYHEKSFDIRKEDTKKPCVGLALYDKRKSITDSNNRPFFETDAVKYQNSWPEKKMWPLETNLKLINLLLSAGYDIMSLDSAALRLDDKIYMLNEHCDLVIGYEGGLHHIAHTLNIPSIVLPWSYPVDPTDNELVIHSLHLDKKTWFPSSVDDVLNLTPETLYDLRNQLVADQGNNIFLNNKIGFSKDYRKLRIHDGFSDSFKEVSWHHFIPPTHNVISHIINKKIGGINDFYYF